MHPLQHHPFQPASAGWQQPADRVHLVQPARWVASKTTVFEVTGWWDAGNMFLMFLNPTEQRISNSPFEGQPLFLKKQFPLSHFCLCSYWAFCSFFHTDTCSQHKTEACHHTHTHIVAGAAWSLSPFPTCFKNRVRTQRAECLCGSSTGPFEKAFPWAMMNEQSFQRPYLALMSAKRVNDICTLSVLPSCLSISKDRSAATLANSLIYTKSPDKLLVGPEVLYSRSSSPCLTETGQKKHLTGSAQCSLRQTQQLFVHYRGHTQDMALSKQDLSHWLRDAITQAYNAAGVEPPQGVQAHTKRALYSSIAFFRGMTAAYACVASSWASPCPFIHFYLHVVSESSKMHSVLNMPDDALSDLLVLHVYLF